MKLTDRSFDLLHASEYTLSVRFIPAGFCFMVFDSRLNKVLFFSEVTDKNKDPKMLLKEHVSNDPVLQASYENVLWVCFSDLYTLIPSAVFEDREIGKYWNLAFGDKSDDVILLTDKPDRSEMVNLYTLSTELKNYVQGMFPSVRFMNQQSIHIFHSMTENRKHGQAQVFLQIEPDFFDAVVLEKGKLILANAFRYRNTDEFLYFTLNLYNRFNLNRDTELIVSGEVSGRDKKITELKKYIFNIVFKTVQTDVSGIHANKIDPFERYVNFLNLPLCEL